MPNVIVGCKLPHGLIIKTGGKSVTLNGANSSKIIGGYGLTSVDKDVWDAWSKEYAGYAPLKNGLIFAQDSANKAGGQAAEQVSIKSGLEPLTPEAVASGVKAEAYDGKPEAKED